MHIRILSIVLLLACAGTKSAGAAEVFDIGLAASGAEIHAMAVTIAARDAPTVVLVGGIHGEDASAAAVRAAVAAYESRARKPVNLLAVPLANPDASPAVFPPEGVAYREHAESHALWRWLGGQAPDLVLIAGSDDAGLGEALRTQSVAGMGRILARPWSGRIADLSVLHAVIPKSEAHTELEQRRARSPRQLAQQLAERYGRDFDPPWYIGAIALIARARLGELDAVRRIVAPYVEGTKDSLARPSALVMAGHTVFTELARDTHDPRYVALVRRVADLGFDPSGQMLEAMPYNDGFSDSVYMGTVIVAQAGALSGERRYFDMADRHLHYMEQLDLRPDGLYRHQNATDAAWGRGNGFAALGLALALSELPHEHPGFAHALASYRRLMAALLPLQTRDGLWRNVVDHPGAYGELSATAMIGFAMQHGLANGWIEGQGYQAAVRHAWVAVDSRSSASGTFIDVCESTARMTSLTQYLQRAAILGTDPRGGAMVMLFATELMGGEAGSGPVGY
jgi:rhamnogalacturonyl hydrolase YesR